MTTTAVHHTRLLVLPEWQGKADVCEGLGVKMNMKGM